MRELRNPVVQVRRFDGPDGLEVVDAPLPTAGRGEVRVRVLASSVQYIDVLIRRHLYPQTAARRPPFVLGYDVVGEIDQLGDGVRDFQVGDRVADLTVVGSNAAYRTLRGDRLARVPAGLDAAKAATLILSWTTAYQLLHRAARVQRGQRVLVHGAAGAVGQALLALGRLAGLELWGTARGEHAALIRELGATPIDYQREDCTRVLPGGFDVVFDGIGEEGYRRSLAALKPGGLLCAYGYSAGVQAHRRMFTMLMWIARLCLWRWLPGGKRAGFYSINLMRTRHPAWFREDLERLFGLLATRAIRPRVAERISFDEVAEAHRRLEAGGLEGKLILCPDLPSRRDRVPLTTSRDPLPRLILEKTSCFRTRGRANVLGVLARYTLISIKAPALLTLFYYGMSTDAPATPLCPDCREPMKLVKMMHLGGLPEIFVFYCSRCKQAETKMQEQRAA